ncbi:MAG: hypothetical protein ACQEV6_08185 [Pseudomonadota bacterium]
MRVVLHIGAPKTGTSAIQYFLNTNRDRLQKYGIFYPPHSSDSNRISGGHGALLSGTSADSLDDSRACAQRWLDDALAQKCHTLLLSSESFYTGWKVLPGLFEGHDLQVLAYARDPVELLVSNHNQSIKRHFGTESLQDFLRRSLASENRGVNGDIFFDWGQAVGTNRMRVLPYYRPAFPKERIELGFLAALGMVQNAIRKFQLPPNLINTSYTLEALELKRLLNPVLNPEDRDGCHQIDLFLQHYSDQRNRGRQSSRKIPVTDDVLGQLYEKFQATNHRLLDQLVSQAPDGFLQQAGNFEPGHTARTASVCELYEVLRKEHPVLTGNLEARVSERLQRAHPSFSLYKLASVMGLPFNEPGTLSDLNDRMMSVFRAPKSQAADYLRELALMLLQKGMTQEAHNVMKEAKKLRPRGKVIDRLLTNIEEINK